MLKNVVSGLKIDEKKANAKVRSSGKINIHKKKKKIVERKRKLISVSTGCKRVSPYKV